MEKNRNELQFLNPQQPSSSSKPSSLLHKIISINSHYLSESHLNPLPAASIIILENLQLLGITSTSRNTILNSSIAMFFEAITGVWLSGIISLAGIVVVALVLLAVLLAKVKDESARESVCVGYHCYARLGFVPVMNCVLAVLVRSGEEQSSVIVSVLAALGLSLQLLLTLNYELFFFTFSLQPTDNFSRNPHSPYPLLLSKTLLLLLTTLSYSLPSLFIIVLFLSVLHGFCLARSSCIKSSYQNLRLDKVQGVASAVFLTVNACYLLGWALRNQLVQRNQMVMVAVVLGFALRFYLNFRNNRLKRVLGELGPGRFNSEDQADLYFKSYMEIFRNGHDRKSQLYMSALLKTHMNECVEVSCCCRRRGSLYDPKSLAYSHSQVQPHMDLVFFKHFLMKMLEDSLAQFKGSVLLTLCQGFFNLQILLLYTKSTQYIHHLLLKSKKLQLSLPQLTLLSHLQSLLLHLLHSKNTRLQHPLPIQNIRTFDLLYNSLLKLIVTSCGNFSEMWQLANSYTESLVPRLAQNCRRNLLAVFEIERKFREMVGINCHSSDLRDLMELYARYVLFDMELLAEVGKKVKGAIGRYGRGRARGNQMAAGEMFADNCCLLVVSPEPKPLLGMILWSSKTCLSIFGHPRQSLLHRSLNTLMPHLFSRHHDSLLCDWNQTGIQHTINRFKNVWTVDSQGYCNTCRIYAKVLPDQLSNYQLLGFIQQLEGQENVILDEEGEISCVGRRFGEVLGLTPRQIKEGFVNVQVLCPDLMGSFRVAGQELPKWEKGLEKNFGGGGPVMSCVMCVPKELPALVKAMALKKQNLFGSFGVDVRMKNYQGLGEKVALKLRFNYLLYLKTQSQMIGEQPSSFYKLKAVLQRRCFIVGGRKQHYCVMKIQSLRLQDDLQEKYLDKLQAVCTHLGDYLAKLKQVSRMMQSDDKSIVTTQAHTEMLRSALRKKTAEQFTYSQKDKKRLAMLTIKMLRESSIHHSRFRKQNLPKLRRSQPPERAKARISKVDQIRVRKNIHRIKLSLVKQGIFSAKMLQVLQLTRQQSFLKTRMNMVSAFTSNNSSESSIGSSCAAASFKLSQQSPECNNVIQSLGSNTSTISMSSAIRSLKEQLKKLRSPRILRRLNWALLAAVALLMGVLGVGLWGFTDSTEGYMRSLTISLEAITMQSRLLLAYDGLLMAEAVGIVGGVGEWRAEALETVGMHLKHAGELMHKHQSQSLAWQPSSPPIDSLQYDYQYLRLIYHQTQRGEFRFLLMKMYGSLIDMQRHQQTSKTTPSSPTPQSQFFNDNFPSLKNTVKKSVTVNQNLCEKRKQKVEKYLFGVAGAVAAGLMILLGVVLWMTGKVVEKIDDTLHLFSKVSRRDTRRYMGHFQGIVRQVKEGRSIPAILDVLRHTKEQDTPTNDITKPTNTQSPPQQPSTTTTTTTTTHPSSCSPYLSITLLTLLLLACLISCLMLSYSLLNRTHTTQALFFDIINEQKLYLHRRVTFKLMMVGRLQMGLAAFKKDFENKQMDFPERLAMSYGRGDERYREFLQRLVSGDVCVQVLKLEDPRKCQQSNKGILKHGLIDGMTSTTLFLSTHGPLLIPSPATLLLLHTLQLSNHYILLSFQQLHLQMLQNQHRDLQRQQLLMQAYVGAVGLVLFLGLFVGWRSTYRRISQQASLANAFLLLMPYNVLRENPYVRVYVRREFNVGGTAMQV